MSNKKQFIVYITYIFVVYKIYIQFIVIKNSN